MKPADGLLPALKDRGPVLNGWLDGQVFVPFSDRTRYVREPDQDSPDGRLAFREVDPCGPECHHPVHALGRGKGLRHLEWFDQTEALELGWRSG